VLVSGRGLLFGYRVIFSLATHYPHRINSSAEESNLAIQIRFFDFGLVKRMSFMQSSNIDRSGRNDKTFTTPLTPG